MAIRLARNRAQPSNSGKTRDIIAEKVGFKSGHEAERSLKTVKKIDELEQKGDKEKAEILRDTLNNKSASTPEEMSRYIDGILFV